MAYLKIVQISAHKFLQPLLRRFIQKSSGRHGQRNLLSKDVFKIGYAAVF